MGRKDLLDRLSTAPVPQIETLSDELRPSPTVPSAPPRLSVRVLLFATLRDAVGRGEMSVDLPAGATGADLLDRLGEEHEAVRRHRPVVRLAVNQRYTPAETTLADGDEVALITPVSGG